MTISTMHLPVVFHSHAEIDTETRPRTHAHRIVLVKSFRQIIDQRRQITNSETVTLSHLITTIRQNKYTPTHIYISFDKMMCNPIQFHSHVPS